MKISINFHNFFDKGNNKKGMTLENKSNVKVNIQKIKGLLIEQLLKNEENLSSKEGKDNLIKYLKDMGVDSTKDNMETLKKVLKSQIPANKELFKKINSIKIKYSMLKEMNSKDVKLPKEIIKKDLNKISVKELKSLLDKPIETKELKGVSKEEITFLVGDKTSKEELATKKESMKLNFEKNTHISESLDKNNKADKIINKDKIHKDNNIYNKKDLTKNEVIKDNRVEDKILFLIKNNMKTSIENLDKSKYIFKEESITKDIKDLLHKIKDPKIRNVIKKIILSKLNFKEISSLKGNIKDTHSLLELIKEELSDKTNSSEKEQINKILEGMKFFEKVNKEMYYVQTPLLIEDEMRQLELYMEKENSSKKSKSGDNISFELETKNLGNIMCNLNMHNEKLNLKFYVDDEKTLEKIEKKEDKLRENLDYLELEEMIVKYIIGKQDENVYLENKKFNFVDIKV